MRRYDSYKDSGVEWIGEIPSHWGKSKFKYLTIKDVQYGINSSSDNYSDGGIRFIRTTDISNNGELSEEGVFINEEIVPQFQITEYLDFLISRSGTLGRTYLHLTNEKMTYGGYLVRFNFSKLELSKFINFYCLSTPFWDWIELNTIVSTIGNVNGQKYSNLELPLPPFSEQQQIVSYLDTKTSLIDSLIEKTYRKIELLKENRTSLINEVVTKGLNPNVEMKDSGVEWIGEIPSGWEKKKIGYVSKLFTGNPWKSELFNFENGIKIVRGENVSEGFLRWGSRTRFWVEPVEEDSIFYLKDGDIVIGMDGSKVGKNYVRIKEGDLPLLLHQRMCRIRVSEGYSPKFIEYWIGSEMFRFYIDISKTDPMIPHITQKNIFDFQIPFPSLSEQLQIVSYLDEHTQLIDKTISVEERRIELLKEYRQSLISEVVTGKRKVVN
jgi:type I restriction enzyme S subunit